MMARNSFVAYKARGRWTLPPPIQSHHSCRSCMVLPLCAVAHAALDRGSGDSFGLPETFQNLTSTLADADCDFLRHWLSLLELERRATAVPQSHIWAVEPPPVPEPGNAAQAKTHPLSGCCIGHLHMLSYDGECSDAPLYPFLYTFAQTVRTGRPLPLPTDTGSVPLNDPSTSNQCAIMPDEAASLLGLDEQGFAEGDACILSIQDAHPAVNRARVAGVTPITLTLACRSRMLALEHSSGIFRLSSREDNTVPAGQPFRQAACHATDVAPSRLSSDSHCSARLHTAPHPAPSLNGPQRSCGSASLPSQRQFPLSRCSQTCDSADNMPQPKFPPPQSACGPRSFASQPPQCSTTVPLPSEISRSYPCPITSNVHSAKYAVPLPHAAHPAHRGARPEATLCWRVDKDEGETALQCAMAGLLELVGGTSPLLVRLRGLIVHLKPPQHGARDSYATETAEEEDCFEEMQAAECAPPS